MTDERALLAIGEPPRARPEGAGRWRDAGRVAAVLRAAGLEVRIARRNHFAKVGEIVTDNPRCPFWGTVVIDPRILALWWDRYATAGDESSAVAVTAAIIAWMAGTPGTPARQGVGLRILPPPEEDPPAESKRYEVQRRGEGP